jgi:hypothetical protein
VCTLRVRSASSEWRFRYVWLYFARSRAALCKNERAGLCSSYTGPATTTQLNIRRCNETYDEARNAPLPTQYCTGCFARKRAFHSRERLLLSAHFWQVIKDHLSPPSPTEKESSIRYYIVNIYICVSSVANVVPSDFVQASDFI